MWKVFICEIHIRKLETASLQAGFCHSAGSYVGQSEQQLKDALTTAENVSPASYGSMRLKKDYPELPEALETEECPPEWLDSFCSGCRNAKTGVCCSNSQ